jgi:hypothetical protein
MSRWVGYRLDKIICTEVRRRYHAASITKYGVQTMMVKWSERPRCYYLVEVNQTDEIRGTRSVEYVVTNMRDLSLKRIAEHVSDQFMDLDGFNFESGIRYFFGWAVHGDMVRLNAPFLFGQIRSQDETQDPLDVWVALIPYTTTFQHRGWEYELVTGKDVVEEKGFLRQLTKLEEFDGYENFSTPFLYRAGHIVSTDANGGWDYEHIQFFKTKRGGIYYGEVGSKYVTCIARRKVGNR